MNGTLEEIVNAFSKAWEPLGDEADAVIGRLRACYTRSELIECLMEELREWPAGREGAREVLHRSFSTDERHALYEEIGLPESRLLPHEETLKNLLVEFLAERDFQVSYDWEAAKRILKTDREAAEVIEGGGRVLGFVLGNKIFLNPEEASPGTVLHEYTHLWAKALRIGNPAEWANVVALLRDNPIWDEVARRYRHLSSDDLIAEEVLATYSGRRGEERLQKMAQGRDEYGFLRSGILSIKEALRRFWSFVGDFLHIHYKSASEVADRVFHDLVSRVDPVATVKSSQDGNDEVIREFQEFPVYTEEMRRIIEKAKADGTYLLAPGGAPSRLDERQWAMVRTKRFKEWFGDWMEHPESSSQVVDDHGEPLVVYHGSRTGGFTVFDSSLGESQSEADPSTVYFSDTRERAYSYAGSHQEILPDGTIEQPDTRGIYACFLNIRDPWVCSFEGASWDGVAYGKYSIYILDEEGEFQEELIREDGGRLFDSSDEASDYAEEQGYAYYEIREDPYIGEDTNSVARMALRDSFSDGVIIDQVVDDGSFGINDPGTDYIVFSPGQIKSASYNLGEFRKEEMDIRFHLTASEEESRDALSQGGGRHRR